MANEYQTLPIASQCGMRWLAHHMRMNELKRTLGESLLFIQYESFANDTATTIINLQQFLGLKNPIPTPEVRVESLSKWKSQLSDEQVAQIQNIVGIHPPA